MKKQTEHSNSLQTNEIGASKQECMEDSMSLKQLDPLQGFRTLYEKYASL